MIALLIPLLGLAGLFACVARALLDADHRPARALVFAVLALVVVQLGRD